MEIELILTLALVAAGAWHIATRRADDRYRDKQREDERNRLRTVDREATVRADARGHQMGPAYYEVPVAFTRPVEDEAEPPDPLTDEEWVALKAVLEPHRLWSLFLVTAVIGLRESEVIGLRWSDWDAEARTLRVFEQEARTISGKRHRKEAKSGSKRIVVLPEFVAAVLREYQRAQMKWRLKVGRAWEDNDLIWPSQVGTALGHRNLLRLLHEACRKAGIRRISFHTLRHSAGTVMLEAGLPERTIMDILGHRSIQVTRRYQRVREGLKRQAADELDRHWEGLA